MLIIVSVLLAIFNLYVAVFFDLVHSWIQTISSVLLAVKTILINNYPCIMQTPMKHMGSWEFLWLIMRPESNPCLPPWPRWTMFSRFAKLPSRMYVCMHYCKLILFDRPYRESWTPLLWRSRRSLAEWMKWILNRFIRFYNCMPRNIHAHMQCGVERTLYYPCQ